MLAKIVPIFHQEKQTVDNMLSTFSKVIYWLKRSKMDILQDFKATWKQKWWDSNVYKETAMKKINGVKKERKKGRRKKWLIKKLIRSWHDMVYWLNEQRSLMSEHRKVGQIVFFKNSTDLKLRRRKLWHLSRE